MRIALFAFVSLIAWSTGGMAQNNLRPLPGKIVPLNNLAVAPTLEQRLDQLDASVAEVQKQSDALAAELDKASKMGETESVRLQMAMDRLSKAQSALSNIAKKMSDTASSISQNMK